MDEDNREQESHSSAVPKQTIVEEPSHSDSQLQSRPSKKLTIVTSSKPPPNESQGIRKTLQENTSERKTQPGIVPLTSLGKTVETIPPPQNIAMGKSPMGNLQHKRQVKPQEKAAVKEETPWSTKVFPAQNKQSELIEPQEASSSLYRSRSNVGQKSISASSAALHPDKASPSTNHLHHKQVYEMKMPGHSKGHHQVFQSKSATESVPINPRSLGSLVQALKSYLHDKQVKKNKKRLSKKSLQSDSIKDGRNIDAFTEEDAELLSRYLYGDLSSEIAEFLEERRDCERELEFKEATFPKWVTYLWKVHFIYEFCTSVVLLISVFYGTYAALFRNHGADNKILDFVDMIIAIDVIIRLVIELWRNVTNCQYEVFTVNYKFFLAIMDLLALIPVAEIFMFFADTNDIYNLFKIPLFDLVKFLHIFRMVKILDKLEDDINYRGNLQLFIFIIRYVIHYVLIVHLLACILFYMGGKTYLEWLLNRNPESASDKRYVTFLTIREHLHDPPPQFFLPFPEPEGMYILTLYLVVATISTVGFGDFFPTNNVERSLIILIMMTGAIWISGELAYKLGTFFSDLDSSRYMMFFRIRSIKIHLRNYQLSDFICKRTEQYYHHLWRYRKGVHEIDLTYLPHCVQEEIKFDICEEMFFKSSMFRGLDENFLMKLAQAAKVSLYSPRMILFERGNITKQMSFIIQGEVAVAADLDEDHISAIHRQGCLIGEINLFMALPYEQTLYTKTVCTIMTITKKDLMLSLQDNPHIFAILRDRMEKKRDRFRNAFTLVEEHPYVQWLYPNNGLEGLGSDPEFPVEIYDMNGWNKPVTGYPIEHEDEQIIIEMPCLREDLKRNEAHAYRLVSVPQIYYAPGVLLSTYNLFNLIFWLIIQWLAPLCATYEDFEEPYFQACVMLAKYWPAVMLLCALDLFIEIYTACPSTGLRFKLMDGLAIKRGSFGFYFDLINLLPLELFHPHWITVLIRMMTKFWKMSRMWSYMDERSALKLFYFRIAKMMYYLLYLTYIIGLFLVCLVCEPGRGKTCNELSFYNPVYPTTRWERIRAGLHLEQYILATPIVFSSSLLTSVGFGNVFAQTTKEMLWAMAFMIFGHFFVSFILAQLTSALAARLTPKLLFHQKLLVVETFVRQNGLSAQILGKLVEHYDLQHQYVSECSLPPGTHLMFDGHKTLQDDVFLVEGEIFFDGVPAFCKMPAQAIIDISRLMKRFVVPPDLIFVQRGEVRRELYVIVNGSVAFYQHGDKAASSILKSTGHFGLRDLLFGEPYPYKVKTLSYVVLYAVDYSVFQKVLGDDEGLQEYIRDEVVRREEEIRMNLSTRIVDEDGPSQRDIIPPNWIRYPTDPDVPIIGGDLTYNMFEKAFLYHPGSNFIRNNTMGDIVHPAGRFATLWQGFMGLAAVVNTIFLFLETFMGFKEPIFRIGQFLLDLVFCGDIYLKCHFAYFDYEAGAMRYHPVKTWVRYVFKGTFFIEVAMMIPLELFVVFMGSTNFFGYGPGHGWYSKLRWIRFLRVLKFIELYIIVHRIFQNRIRTMFIFYMSIAVLMTTILGSLAFFLVCPTFGYDWNDGDQYKLPVCDANSWVNYKYLEQISLRDRYKPTAGPALPENYDQLIFSPRSITERWAFGMYYIGQILMVIGFGDQASFRKDEVYFLTMVALFGFIVCQAIISDITSAQIDTDEIRAQNRESLDRLSIALTREGAPKQFTKYIRSAFRLSWSYARGLQINDLFDDLHPMLHRELMNEYIGDIFERVPIFLGLPDPVVNSLKRKVSIEYYPRGALVTHAGDLDYTMYIVVKGELWVCDKNDRWICSMSSGESIGEMSLIYAARRRYSAYAATHLHALVLKAVDFATVLETFPLTRKQIVKSLVDYKRDSYLVKAWKWRVRNTEDYLNTQENNTKLLKLFSMQNLSRIPVRGFTKKSEQEKKISNEPGFFRKIIGYGCSDTMNHYIYFASDNDKFNLVLHPSCLFYANFLFLVQIVRFFAPMVALFHVFFFVNSTLDKDVTDITAVAGHTFDTILWIDIFLKFFIATEVGERKTYCKSLGKNITQYLFRPTGFLYDIIVAFPYDIVTANKATKLMVFRCLLSIKYFSNLWRLKDDIEVSTLQFKIGTSISFLLYLAHILACLFFYSSCRTVDFDSCKPDGWVWKFRLEFGKLYGPPPPGESGPAPTDIKELYTDHRPSHWYMLSLYWVMTVLTTVGFGDITPTSFHEICFAVVCIFFGSLFLSIMLGNITTGLSSLNKTKREFLGKVEKMLDYLRIIGLSSVAYQTLGAYCNMTWNNCRGVNYNDIASILPLYVQQDVYLALYHKCITQCLFFGKDYDFSFVKAICSRVRHYMFLPGMRITNEFEPGTGIYIVMRGAVTSFQLNPESGSYEFIKRYEENQVFGRIPGLFPGALYNKSYRAEDKTEVLLMYHTDMRQLLTKFPKWRFFLQEMIYREYSYFSRQTSLKNITEKRLEMHERLYARLTEDQFMEAADMFTADLPNRKEKFSKEDDDEDEAPSNKPSNASLQFDKLRASAVLKSYSKDYTAKSFSTTKSTSTTKSIVNE